MPRQVRIEYPGAIYHVMSRGNRRQDIYLSDVDRHDVLKTFAEACEKTAWHSSRRRSRARTSRSIWARNPPRRR